MVMSRLIGVELLQNKNLGWGLLKDFHLMQRGAVADEDVRHPKERVPAIHSRQGW